MPLTNIRVVDFSQWYAGPAATEMLADLGADVIKVEPPGGDAIRAISRIPDSMSLSFGHIALNRNKRGVIIDITKPKGLEVAHRLVRWADVMVTNMRSGVARRMGLEYEDLASINPRLVFTSITGFGETGPDAAQPGYDIVVQARGGSMANARLPDGSVVPTNTPYSAMSTAILAAYGIMLALRDLERTGQGQKVEVNLLNASLVLQSVQMIETAMDSPMDLLRLPSAPVNCFPCNDGRYLQLNVVAHHWQRFSHAIGLDYLAQDPFDTPEKRIKRSVELHGVLAHHFATKPAADWDVMLKEANVPANIVQESLEEVFEDPQALANGMFVQFHQPGLGPVTVVDSPIRFSGLAGKHRLRRHAPEIGEHTVEVLQELGYGFEEILKLQTEGVLG